MAPLATEQEIDDILDVGGWKGPSTADYNAARAKSKSKGNRRDDGVKNKDGKSRAAKGKSRVVSQGKSCVGGKGTICPAQRKRVYSKAYHTMATTLRRQGKAHEEVVSRSRAAGQSAVAKL